MTEKPTRRRRRTLLVPLLGIGVAAWAVRSRLAERGTLHDGWQPLPPRRGTPDRTAAETPEPAAEPAPVPGSEPAPRLTLAVPGSVAEAAPEPEPVAAPAPEPVLARARTVPAATAVASVTAPALPDAPGLRAGARRRRVAGPGLRGQGQERDAGVLRAGQRVLRPHARGRLVPHGGRRLRRRLHGTGAPPLGLSTVIPQNTSRLLRQAVSNGTVSPYPRILR